MPAERINYVLCAWSGPRRTPDSRRYADPAFYLKAHIKSLETLQHHLAQITVVVPNNPNEAAGFRQALWSLPATIRDANVVVLHRENHGLSYGSFSDCYARYRQSFDYYVFMEDDYVFAQNDFDLLHLRTMRENRNCGYICGLATETPEHPLHAAVANGMLRTSALEAVFTRRGALPHALGADYRQNEISGQIGLSRAILAHGFSLTDWRGSYQVRFRHHSGALLTCYPGGLPVLMEPI